jgi:glycosyltransferase involved in cell wall biosynthesis
VTLRIGLAVDSFGHWLGGMNFFLTLSEALAQAARACGAEVRLIATAPKSLAATLPDGTMTMAPASARGEGPLGGFLRQTRFEEICLAQDLATAARRLELSVVGPSTADLGAGFPVPWCAYVRDVQHRRLPQLFPDEERSRRDSALARLIANSQLTLVNSPGARAELEAREAEPGSRPSIVCLPQLLPSIADQLPGEATVRCLFGLEGPYFVCCSQQQWVHKQHQDIIQAFALSVSEPAFAGTRLVFTGQPGDYRRPEHRESIERLIGQLGLTERVYYVGFIDRPLQLALIRHALALLQASVYEETAGASGVAEAACLGTPVIASDIPANRALGFGEVSHFPPGDVGQLSQLLRARLTKPERAAAKSAAEVNALNVAAGARLIEVLSRHAAGR